MFFSHKTRRRRGCAFDSRQSFLPAHHWLATGGSSPSSIGWLLKPLSTVASDWIETQKAGE